MPSVRTSYKDALLLSSSLTWARALVAGERLGERTGALPSSALGWPDDGPGPRPDSLSAGPVARTLGEGAQHTVH